jgi:hypothetical protein
VSRWLQTEPPVENNQLYKIREGEWATWEINGQERGRFCRDRRAGSRERATTNIGSMLGEGGKGIEPVVSGLSYQGY